VAQEQRQWATAEAHYQQALQLFIEFNDEHGQARLYHGFGRVAEELEKWSESVEHFLNALAIFYQFRDQHTVEITLNSIRRVWQAAQSSPAFDKKDILNRLATILNITPSEAQSLLEQTNNDAS